VTATRGTTNRNERGNAEDRRRRREWLLKTYEADVVVIHWLRPSCGNQVVSLVPLHPSVSTSAPNVIVAPTCRCYRCGKPLWLSGVVGGVEFEGTLTVDRIKPHKKGGTYARTNIRPACAACNSETGGALASRKGKKS
jgi:hypothetical protein